MTTTDISETLIERVERLRAAIPLDPSELEAAASTARATAMGAAAVGVTVSLALSPEDRARGARRRLMRWAEDTLEELRAAEPAPTIDTRPLKDLSMEPIEMPRETKPTVEVPTPEEVTS